MNFYPNFGAPDFLSPISGRVLCDYLYILEGNIQNIATPSPVLIDIRLDLAALLENLANTDFVIGHPKPYLTKAQVLVSLANGYMYNTAGIVSTKSVIPVGDIALTKGHILVGDADNKAADTAFPSGKLATGDIDDTLKFVDHITLAQMSDLTNSKLWQGNGSNRPVEVTLSEAGIAPANATYFLRDADAALPNAQALADLFTPIIDEGAIAFIRGPLTLTGPTGSITKAQASLLDPLFDYVSPFVFLTEFWVPEWLPLVAEVEAIQAELVVIEAAIAALQAQVIDLFTKAARPLNVIATDNPGTGDVSFNNFKGTLFADPTAAQDAVNLRTLNRDKASAGLAASSAFNAITATPAQLTLGATPNISATNFTTNPSSFVYTGTEDINALVLLVCQIEPDVAGEISIAFYLNGATFTGGSAEPYLTTNKNMVVVQAAVALSTGDEVTIYGASALSTNWSIYNINWTIHSIGLA